MSKKGTSRRPGRSTASSIMSFRFVIPITRILFRLYVRQWVVFPSLSPHSARSSSNCTILYPTSLSSSPAIHTLTHTVTHLSTRPLCRATWTPSIFERSWLTTVSATPVPPPVVPLTRQMESISSKMMICNSELSPCRRYSSWVVASMVSSLLRCSSERKKGIGRDLRFLKKRAYIFLALTHVLVENFWSMHYFWFSRVQHFANLSRHQRFSGSLRSSKRWEKENQLNTQRLYDEEKGPRRTQQERLSKQKNTWRSIQQDAFDVFHAQTVDDVGRKHTRCERSSHDSLELPANGSVSRPVAVFFLLRWVRRSARRGKRAVGSGGVSNRKRQTCPFRQSPCSRSPSPRAQGPGPMRWRRSPQWCWAWIPAPCQILQWSCWCTSPFSLFWFALREKNELAEGSWGAAAERKEGRERKRNLPSSPWWPADQSPPQRAPAPPSAPRTRPRGRPGTAHQPLPPPPSREEQPGRRWISACRRCGRSRWGCQWSRAGWWCGWCSGSQPPDSTRTDTHPRDI